MDEEIIAIQLEIKNMLAPLIAIKQMAMKINDLTSELKGQVSEIKNIENAWKGVASAVKGVRIPRQRSASSTAGTTAAQTAASGAKRGAVASGAGTVGPMARLEAARQALENARLSGNGQQLFDAQSRYVQAQRAQKVAQRIVNQGMNGGGRGILSTFGRGGPLGAVAIAVVLELQKLKEKAKELGVEMWETTKRAAEAGVAFMKMGLQAGGTQSQTGQLSVLSNAFSTDMGEMARQFAETISHGGTAGGFAARAGIHDFGIFDSTNKARKLLAWLRYLDKLSPEEAIRASRATGTEALLPYRNLSDQSKQNLGIDASTKASVFTPEFNKAAQNFMVSFGRLSDTLATFTAQVVTPAIGPLKSLFDTFSMGINLWTIWIRGFQDVIGGMFLSLHDATAGAFQIIKGMAELGTTKGDLQAEEKRTRALDENTNALNENTYAQRNGTHGGGERARGAVPGKWSGMNTERFISEASRLGAFAF